MTAPEVLQIVIAGLAALVGAWVGIEGKFTAIRRAIDKAHERIDRHLEIAHNEHGRK